MAGKSAFIIVLASVMSLLAVFTININKAEAFSGRGSGTVSSPYLIESCAQLQEINSGLSSNYTLVGNVDCNGFTFTSLGTDDTPFTGTLDGQGFTISSLATSAVDTAGLFENMNNATVRNLNLTDVSITATGDMAGGLATNVTNSTVTDISLTGTVSSASWTGGILATARGTTIVSKVHFNGTVTALGLGYTNGIVAVMYDTASIIDSYSEGTINATNAYSGGIVGNIVEDGTVDRTYSTMTINQSGVYLGGLVGTMGVAPGSNPTLTNSFFAGILNTSTNPGGIVGINDGGTMLGNYYDSTTCTKCSNGAAEMGSDTGGTAVSGNSNFKTDNSHAPLTAWNFTSVWQAVSNSFPILRTVTIPTAPSAPTSFGASRLGTTATLTWAAPSTTGSGSRAAYEIQYKSNTDSDWTTQYLTNSDAVSTTITGLTLGKTYSFRIRALNTAVYGSRAVLTDALTISKAAAVNVPNGLKLLNNADGTNLATNGAAGIITAKLVDSETGLILSTFDIDLSTNRDFSGVIGNVNTSTGKAVISGIGAVSGVGATHTLYVPKLTGQTKVRICPNATSIDQVTTDCGGGTTYAEGDSNVSVVTVGSQSYWKITGLTGTGGVGITEASATAATSASPSPSTSPAPTATLADTGDNQSVFILSALALLTISLGALYVTRRLAPVTA